MLNITNLPEVDRKDVTLLVMTTYYHLSRWYLGDKLTHHEKESIASILSRIARLNTSIQHNDVNYANGNIDTEKHETRLNNLCRKIDDLCKKHNLSYTCDNDVAGIRLYNGEHELTFLLNQ